jgi:hypothetical protein
MTTPAYDSRQTGPPYELRTSTSLGQDTTGFFFDPFHRTTICLPWRTCLRAIFKRNRWQLGDPIEFIEKPWWGRAAWHGVRIEVRVNAAPEIVEAVIQLDDNANTGR